jgi:uncharacterized protein YkwD
MLKKFKCLKLSNKRLVFSLGISLFLLLALISLSEFFYNEFLEWGNNSDAQEVDSSVVAEDLTPPEFKALSPSEDVTCESDKIVITGEVEEANLFINGEQVEISENKFTKEIGLFEGENKIELILIDSSGNKTEENLTVTYNKPIEVVAEVKSESIPSTSTSGESSNSQVITSPPSHDPTCVVGAEENEIFNLINQQRVNNGVAPFIFDSTLNCVADLHSQDQAQMEAFTHYGSDGSTFDQRCTRAGTTCSAENVGWAPENNLGRVVSSWMASTGHRTNMLNPSYTRIGIGHYGTYATAVFGK